MTESSVELSLVIPSHNEEGSLLPLIAAIRTTMAAMDISYEVILNDDGSTDNSWRILKEIAADDPRIRLQRFKQRSGKSAAIWAGFKIARGRYIATIDADLQNDLSDLPVLLGHMGQYDCVSGTRVATRLQGDSAFSLRVSAFANWVRNRILNEHIADSGCGYRIIKRECIAHIKFFRGAHRFLPTLIKMEGFSVLEVPVKNNRRLYGRSHYGISNRLLDSLTDLFGVLWLKNRLIRFEITETLN